MTYQELWRRLTLAYVEGEAKAIARMVYEVRYGLTLSDILMGRDTQVPVDELEELAQRLERHEPVQYVLGQTDFCGHTFKVNKHTLIPRPETEELCQWVTLPFSQANESIKTDENPRTDERIKMLDIGTGSGCIAITLAAMYPQAKVYAWDISEEALKVASENARCNHVDVDFQHVDILNPDLMHDDDKNPAFSVIISNPPYILNKEREMMESNVLDYEPHTALFVPDDDPLLFYKAIARFGQEALRPDGWLYFEINPMYATALRDLLESLSYHNIELKEDQFGKQRMIRARR